jgi:hypothetical protein
VPFLRPGGISKLSLFIRKEKYILSICQVSADILLIIRLRSQPAACLSADRDFQGQAFLVLFYMS